MSDPTIDESSGSAVGIDGYLARALDGDIGPIEHNSLSPTGYVVVDTTTCTWASKRLIPTDAIEHIDHAQRMVFVRMLKAQVRGAPDFDDERSVGPMLREAAQYYERFTRRPQSPSRERPR